MTAETEEIERALEDFEARQGPEGLLTRYAGARITHFAHRQVLLLLAGAGVWVLASLPVAAVAVALVLAAEAVDRLYLAAVPWRLAAGAGFRRLRAGSTLTAGLHALATAAAALAWFEGPGPPAAAFSLALLFGAAVNAAITLPFHRPAGYLRFAIYALTAGLLFLVGRDVGQAMPGTAPTDLLAALLLGYSCFLFVREAESNRSRHLAHSREILLQGIALARANQEQVARQKELRNLALVAQHANDSVIMSGPDGRIRWVNDAFTRLTGYGRDEAVGRRPADILDAPETDPAVSEGITRAVIEGRPHRTQILNRTRDGRKIWVGINLVPVLDAEGAVELTIAIERDITEIKAREAELAAARLRAEQNEAAKSRFLAIMSHELRTPMNAIIGMADLLSEVGLSREDRQYVETIRRSGEALLTLINDILDFSKLSVGRLATHDVVFRLRDPIDAAVRLLTPMARGKGIFIDLVVQTPLPGRVTGDDGRLGQILINIIGNAVKFTARGGG